MSVDNNVSAMHGSVKSYITGFVLSIIATIIPFFLVANSEISNFSLILLVYLFAVVQFLIQLFFFMHITAEGKPRFNQMSLLFAIVVVFVVVLGTGWVMYNLSYHMHPAQMHHQEMSNIAE